MVVDKSMSTAYTELSSLSNDEMAVHSCAGDRV